MPFWEVAGEMQRRTWRWSYHPIERVSGRWLREGRRMLVRGIRVEVSFTKSVTDSWLDLIDAELSSQLKRWLDLVPEEYTSVKGARIIIAP